jgi:hypothetical protein
VENGKLVVKRKGKIYLGRPVRRWEDNINMVFIRREEGISGLDSAGLGYGPVSGFFFLRAVMNLQVL